MMLKELHLALTLTGLVHETGRVVKALNFIHINLQEIVENEHFIAMNISLHFIAMNISLQCIVTSHRSESPLSLSG